MMDEDNFNKTGARIIIDNLPYLVEHLDVEAAVPVLKSCWPVSVLDSITANHLTQHDRACKLLMYVSELTPNDPLHKAFLLCLAGIQPDLFSLLEGRAQSAKEADTCVKEYSECLKKQIMSKGHCIDRKHDQPINLEKQYVTLRLIAKESSSGKYAQGSIDGHDAQVPCHYSSYVNRNSASISAENMLDDKDTAKMVLVTGRAGIGKSTTMQYLSNKWADGKWLKSKALLFFVRLRTLVHEKSQITVAQLLKDFSLYKPSKGEGDETLHLSSKWIKNHCKRLIIQIDGLDEVKFFSNRMANGRVLSDVSEPGTPVELCLNIIQGNLLNGCTVICTSRPFSGLCTVDADRYVEVIGLTKEGVMCFVDKNVAEERAESVKAVLQQNPILMSICAITFYCMVISKFMEQDCTLTEADVSTYTQLTSFLIVNYATRRFDDASILELKQFLPQLSQLAFNGLFGDDTDLNVNKLVFTEVDLLEAGVSESELKLALNAGLIVSMEGGKPNTLIVEFAHLSLQEMFATLHLLSGTTPSDDGNVQKVMDKLKIDGTFNMVLLYLYGLKYDTGFRYIDCLKAAVRQSMKCSAVEKKIDKKLVRFIKEMSTKALEENNSKLLLDVVLLAYESQSTPAADSAASCLISSYGDIQLANMLITAVDMSALTFVCSQAAQDIKSISLVDVNLDDISLYRLCEFLKEQNQVESLDLSGNQFGRDGLRELGCYLANNDQLKHLTIDASRFRGNPKNMQTFAEGCSENKSLTSLTISGKGLSDDCIEYLCLCLEEKENFEALSLDASLLTVHGIKQVAQCLRTKENLVSLVLTSCNVEMGAIEQISACIKDKQNIKNLCLSGSIIPISGVICIAKSVAYSTLETFDLSRTNIEDHAIGQLFLGLSCCQKLKSIKLEGNPCTDDSIPGVVTAIKDMKNLQYLNMRQCLITKNGARILEESCKEYLVTLDITEMAHTEEHDKHVPGLNAKIHHVGHTFQEEKAKSCIMSDDEKDLSLSMLDSSERLSRISTEHQGMADIGESLVSVKLDTVAAEHLNATEYDEPDSGCSSKIGLKRGLQMTSKESASLNEVQISNFTSGNTTLNWHADHLHDPSIIQTLDFSNHIIDRYQAKQIADLLYQCDSLTHVSLHQCHLENEAAEIILNMVHPGLLRMLDISDNFLTGESFSGVSQAISRFKNLQRLDVSYNYISDNGACWLNELLLNVQNVQQLKVSGNMLSDAGVEAISGSLSQLSVLSSLHIMQNDISPLGFEILIRSLRRLTQLRELDISDNHIRGEQMGELLDKLPNGVELLNLSYCRLIGMMPIVKPLEKLTNLRSLDLSKNYLGSRGMKNLADSLKPMQYLKTLHLQENDMTDNGVELLTRGLSSLSALTTLNLAKNGIGERGMKALAQCKATLQMVSQLDLSDNNLNDSSSTYLSEVIDSTKRLTWLNLKNNALQYAGIVQISQSLSRCTCLLHIDVGCNALRTDSCTSLSVALGEKSIKTLSLHGNPVGARGVEQIFHGIRNISPLQKLDIGRCNLGSVGASTLSKHFKSMVSLEILHMEHNSIGPSDTDTFACGLKQLKNLKDLDISSNNLQARGMRSIAEALKQLPDLEVLALNDNSLGAEGSEFISSALSHLHKLRRLLLAQNFMGREGAKHLAVPLAFLSQLQYLDISSNLFRKEGIDYISAALIRLESIQTLTVGNNAQGEDGTRSLCSSLYKLRWMTKLHIDNTNMGRYGANYLADALKEMPFIYDLAVSQNKLDVKGLENLNQGLESLKFLRVLNLSGNKYSKKNSTMKPTPVDIFLNPRLTWLDLGKNELSFQGMETISRSINKLKWLKFLDLNQNKIGAQGAKFIADALLQCPYIETLDVGDNHLGYDGIKLICQSLYAIPSVKHLILRQNHSGCEAAEILSSSLKMLTQLRTLNVSSNDLGPDGATCIANAIRHLPFLEKLRIGENIIQNQGVTDLSASLCELKQLQNLGVSNNDVDQEGLATLCKSLTRTPNLRHLYIGGNTGGDAGMKHIAMAMNGMIQLETLSLSGAGFSVSGCQYLNVSLSRLENLTDLNLGSNSFGTSALQRLTKSLASLTQLEILRITRNRLNAEGAEVLAEFLPKLRKLKILTLSANNLGPQGCEYLKGALKFLTNLKDLNIGMNSIEDQGAFHLAEALQGLQSLQYLSLQHNKIGDSGGMMLCRQLSSHGVLHLVDLRSNALSTDGASQMLKVASSFTLFCYPCTSDQ